MRIRIENIYFSGGPAVSCGMRLCKACSVAADPCSRGDQQLSEFNCFASCSRERPLEFCNMLNYWNEPCENNTRRTHLVAQFWVFSLQKWVKELNCLRWLFHTWTLMYLVENWTVLCFKVILALWWISLKVTALPDGNISEQSVVSTLTSQGFNW